MRREIIAEAGGKPSLAGADQMLIISELPGMITVVPLFDATGLRTAEKRRDESERRGEEEEEGEEGEGANATASAVEPPVAYPIHPSIFPASKARSSRLARAVPLSRRRPSNEPVSSGGTERGGKNKSQQAATASAVVLNYSVTYQTVTALGENAGRGCKMGISSVR